MAAAALFLASCASAPIRERCGLMQVCVPPPRMDGGLAALDGILFRRSVAMAGSARELKYFMGDAYKREFLEELLPRLCNRIEAARALAGSGKVREAGIRYQGLAVASEVMALEVALVQVAEYADHAGEPSSQVLTRLTAYDRDMAPLMEAALSDDPRRLAEALQVGATRHAEWRGNLERWIRGLQLGVERVEVAHKVWDVSLAVAATYELAGAAAEIAAGSALPPGVAALAGADGAAAVAANRVALAEAAEALRKLIAMGAIDPAVVAGLSQMGGGNPGPVPTPKPMPMAASAPPDPVRVSDIVREAASREGDFGVGTGTRAEAEAAGREWVGPKWRWSSDGRAMVSEDGLRIYRPPLAKRIGVTQANFERKLLGQRSYSNAHLLILDP